MWLQRVENRRQRSTAADRSVGLGQDFPQRLHGLSLFRHLRVDQVSGGGVVQTAHRGGGRVLQRACARGGGGSRQSQDPDAGKCFTSENQSITAAGFQYLGLSEGVLLCLNYFV